MLNKIFIKNDNITCLDLHYVHPNNARIRLESRAYNQNIKKELKIRRNYLSLVLFFLNYKKKHILKYLKIDFICII